MEKIIIASNNKGKIKEVKEIFKQFEIISINDIGLKIDIKEDQDSFEKNAIKKAEEISKIIDGKLCLADDSGIMIEYLDGFPRSIH